MLNGSVPDIEIERPVVIIVPPKGHGCPTALNIADTTDLRGSPLLLQCK